MDEEKESLRRQIQLLQGLINSHKIIHGNAPAPKSATNPRWPTPAQPCPAFHGEGYRQPQSSWRKKYSLVNRTSQVADTSRGSAAPQKSPAATDISQKLGQPKLSRNKDKPAEASAFKWQSAATQESRVQPQPPVPSTTVLRGTPAIYSGSQSQGARKEILKGVSKTQQKVSWTTVNRTTPAQVPAASQPPITKPFVSLPVTKVNCSTPKHQTLVPQKSNETVTANKVTKSRKNKYSWVADSPKAPPKKVSPSAKKMASDVRQKPPETAAAAKGKKNGASPKTVGLKSRYKWKAENVASPRDALQRGAQRAGPQTPQQSKAAAVMASAAVFRDPAPSSYKVKSKTKIIRRRSTSRSPVDKKSSPLAPVTLRSCYSLRRRSSPRVKSPSTGKRSSPRGLIHISKHRLQRLPPPGKQQCSLIREGSTSSSLKSSASNRVIRTRYRIVKRSGTPPLVTSPLSTLSASLNWKTRLLLLNRLRQNQNQQRWRSRGLRVIGGVTYRVSANKLSKTWSPGSGSKQTAKTGKQETSGAGASPLYPARPATPSRYIASRAIQRSLAIIRHAQQQKKEKKEYCMYYNRFGKCNRGDKCPYIHDPEKVAVCTRFLRGTCKKTDGSCPFSHQVSKDKMPVCSYFLKGICHNNDCPYSHVYVSRKAEICPEFLKGYCPMGAKCKKKHTLLCPDFTRDGKCPKGTKCKLQHRQRKRRLEGAAQPERTPTGTKQRRITAARTETSPAPPSDEDELPGSSRLQSCPSYISLNCSSASEGTPVSERVKSSDSSGKPLQIKPRL
ncbi:zinc finger CCCH domain-containing protein 3 [Leptodactylus fuscus]|uniref:zinc finger CCCH domain-containing protein 3 n=1 Tax=Leptodactylus fuscus TaxID=238119 RepID=UPI003F4E6070